ncbi:gp441 [Bacillus phage G]|uniref:Gp441 n=1 Tax=Bacillus phage G TaxID=2884420 RepID=G3MAI2_9CAUD|nr:gp441 [Bacillus phage G]AEO93699.1 gp441 [Bacillus phage G]
MKILFISLAITVLFSLINFFLYRFISKKRLEYFNELFFELSAYQLCIIFCLPVMNIYYFIGMLLDLRNLKKEKINLELGLIEISDLNGTLLNEQQIEKIDAIVTMMTLLDYHIKTKYGIDGKKNHTCLQLTTSSNDINIDLSIYFVKDELTWSNLSIIERGTVVRVESDKIEKCLRLIEDFVN